MISTKEYEANTLTATDFQRNFKGYLEKLQQATEEPYFITKKGKVEAVLLNPQMYDRYLEMQQRMEDLSIEVAVLRGRQSGDSYGLHSSEVQSLLADID